MKRNVLKKFLSLMMSLSLIFGIFGTSYTSYADLQSELESKQEKLDSELSDIENNLSKYKDEASKTDEYLAEYDKKMKLQEEQIENLADQIVILEEDINTLEIDIAKKEIDIAKGVEQFKDRLCLLYVSGNTSYASVLVGATDFYDMLARMEMVRRISKQDNDMIEDLEYQITLLDIDKAELVTKLADAADKKTKSEEYMIELKETYANHETTKAEQQAMIDDYSNRADEIEAEKEETEKELQAEIKRKQAEAEARRKAAEEAARLAALANGESNSKYESFTSYSDTGFIWPAPNVRNITDGYGERWIIEEQRSDFHKGIDISTPDDFGEKIIASAGGEVISAITGWGGGYGNYLVIDHGNGISTVYAHCKDGSLKVGVGDIVYQGQEIAAIGSSGNSYGAHLHFEVRINGQHTEPLNYVNINN